MVRPLSLLLHLLKSCNWGVQLCDWTPPFAEGNLLAKELISRGYKRVSIIDTNHTGKLAVSKAIKEALEGSDVQIVSYDLTNVGDKDFRTTILKVKQAKPDIVVLEMFSPEVEIAALSNKRTWT